MCGITGFAGLEDKALVKAMADVIAHRGPDQDGFFIDKDCCLGHRRLSIIDLSENGRNPMHNEDGTVQIVFNGEIWNYKPLKLMLETRGHKFYSNTDTEVIIHLYEEFGPHMLFDKLDGMFAIALWDSKAKRLVLGRDRFGKKPVYYTTINGVVYFGSEMKSLMQVPGIKRSIDRQALHDYLSFRYVPEPNTLFEGIRKVPAAHYLVWESGMMSRVKYWDLHFSPEADRGESFYATRVADLLEGAVRKRLMSDVPLGLLLSGGIDSASICALMSKQVSDPIKTFTVGYNLPGFEDELKPAKVVADHFKTDHNEIILDFNPAKLLGEAVWHADEPIADPALIPTMMMSRAAKKKITVTLLGEGADEVFGGYEQYKMMLATRMLHDKFPKLAKGQLLSSAIQNTPLGPLKPVFRYAKELGEEGRKRWLDLVVNFGDNAEDYFKIQSIFDEQDKRDLYGFKTDDDISIQPSVRHFSPCFRKDLASPDRGAIHAPVSSDSFTLNNMLAADMRTFLTHLLMKVDKMTMAGSLEARVPFLDKDLVEFMAHVPESYKVRGLTGKYILRKAMVGSLPSHVLKRKKQRFFVPMHKWMQGDMKAVVQDALSPQSIAKRGLFQPATVERMMEKYDAAPLYYGRQVWTLLTLEAWMRQFVDPKEPSKKSLDVF